MDKPEVFKEILAALESQKQAVAATVIKTVPELPGVKAGCRLLWTPDALFGSLGRSDLDRLVADMSGAVFAGGRPRLETLELEEGSVTVFLEPVLAEPDIVILGGGHVGQKVAALADLTGYRVTVVDDRPEFANEALYPPGSKVICESFTSALKRIRVTATTFVVIVTRGHRYDMECLREMALSGAAYIGMIGSRHRVKIVLEQLREEGIPAAALDRIHAPIGLDIGAETPAEIAVSIMAEIIKVYRRGA